MMESKSLMNQVGGNVAYYHSKVYSSYFHLEENRKMNGVKRVIVFCILIVILPATLIIIPLYLRHTVFADVVYMVAESDILEIRDGISSIFCQEHTLSMTSNFNAFQLTSKPEISTNRKHIRLKKSMVLPDDTLEYWGFYLLKGAIVQLKFCSRYEGSRILVVKGERNLKTCGLLEHNKNKYGANFAEGHENVKVTFEDKEEFNMSKEKNETELLHENKHIDDKSSYENTKLNTVIRQNDKTQEKLSIDELENHGGEDTNEYSKNVNASIKLKHGNSKTELKLDDIKNDDANVVNSTEKPQANRKRYRNMKKNPFQDMKLNTSRINDDATNQQQQSTVIEQRQRRNNKNIENENSNEMYKKKLQEIYNDLYVKRGNRLKRDHVYDRKISHGGNALNFTKQDESNSISSFENNLLACYDGKILLAEGFPPSAQCTNVHFLLNNSSHMSKHEVVEDGYYYYIFYSDNDLVRNDIHAIFDIYKPTFQYSNITKLKSKNMNDTVIETAHPQFCINSTNCTFPLNFYSNEYVIVEVPTRDGIEHEEDDITRLISTCHPRMSVYIIFPIAVLVLILTCSFL